jgi:hypothetical protein
MNLFDEKWTKAKLAPKKLLSQWTEEGLAGLDSPGKSS